MDCLQRRHVLSALFVSKTNVDALDALEKTPLHLAVEEGHVSAVLVPVRVLLAGATVDIKTTHGVSQLYLALSCGHGQVAKLLVEAKASLDIEGDPNNSRLLTAAARGDLVTTHALHEARADVNVCDSRLKATPLHLTALCGHNATLQVLIDARATMDAQDFRGRAALLLATQHGHSNCQRMLIAATASVDVRHRGLTTPLLWAAVGGNIANVQLLVKAKAVLDIGHDLGQTPSRFAASNGHAEVVQLVVNARVNLQVANKDNHQQEDEERRVTVLSHVQYRRFQRDICLQLLRLCLSTQLWRIRSPIPHTCTICARAHDKPMRFLINRHETLM